MAEHQNRLEELTARLREQGHRVTPQRMAILKIVIGNKEHLSVEQIYERVKKVFPMTSMATVYKTINLLKEMGEIIELDFGEDGSRYDGGNPHPHPHLICTRCRKIIDFDMPQLTELSREVARRTGYEITKYRLDFFGICPKCQENE